MHKRLMEYILRDADDYFTLEAWARRTVNRLIIFFAIIGVFIVIAVLLERCG